MQVEAATPRHSHHVPRHVHPCDEPLRNLSRREPDRSAMTKSDLEHPIRRLQGKQSEGFAIERSRLDRHDVPEETSNQSAGPT